MGGRCCGSGDEMQLACSAADRREGGCHGARSRTCRFPPVDPLETYVRAGLELAGEQLDDIDMAVIRAADAVYGPGMRALDAADLSDVLPEPDLDPGRPPRPL
jgi:hypothetical protein